MQAPAGSRIFNPGIYRTGFCKIPGSRDFLGRVLPEILSRDFTKKVRDLSGFASQRINRWSISYILEDLFVCTLDRQRSHPFHPVASSKSGRVFSVPGNVVTQ